MSVIIQMEEEQQKKENQKEINVISLMKSPQEFRKMFEDLRKMAADRLRMHEFQSAIDYYLKCVDMLDLGKNLLSSASQFMKPCLFISLAAAYQGAWKIQKCNKFCQKGEQQLLKLINEENQQQYLKVSKHLVTLKFQHCAILSQLNQHQKALETCKSTLKNLQRSVQIIINYSKQQEESFNNKYNDEGVMFSKKVYGLANQILLNLIQQLVDGIELKQSKSSAFYFWQRNPQKNQEQLKKTFLPQSNNNSKRSILGVNKQNHWVDEFNIGSIMRMSEVKPQSFDKIVPMEEYLFKDKLYQAVIHCSLAFFTIATEMRFIDAEKNGEPQDIKNDKEINRLQNIKKKYGYEQKSQMFKLSEAYHLRAIQIVSSNIQSPIPYLTHMIKSYDKHYVFKKKLQEIVAIGDESVLEMSSIVHPTNSRNQSKLQISKEKQLQQPYGNQIAVINRQQSEQDQEIYNDYHQSNTESLKNGQQSISKKIEAKQGRNTIKYFHSQPHQEIKGRTKSLGKLRRTKVKPSAKEEQQDKNQINQTSNPKIKKRKDKQKEKDGKTERDKEKQKEKDDKTKKTRIRLTQIDGQGELQVRTKSSTHIKFVFKKKK